MNDNDSLALFNATLTLVAFPAHILVPASSLNPASGSVIVETPADMEIAPFTVHLGASSQPREGSTRLKPTVNATAHAAVAHIRNMRTKKATRVLSSKGVAPRTELFADLGVSMHPKSVDEVVLPEASADRIELDEEGALASLLLDSQRSQASPDVFGWSPDLLACIAKAKAPHPGARAPLEVFARFKHILALADIPDAVAVLLTAGSLTLLNKVEQEENDLRVAKGETPKCRPVNGGNFFLKQALVDVTKTPSALRAKASLSPIQLGLGVSGGPDRMAWLAHKTLEEGGVVDVDDAVSAFNELKRQAVLDATKIRWSEGMQLVNKYYGMPSIVLFAYYKDGQLYLRVILGREGVRMGCPLGSFCFDLTLDHFVYSKLAEEYKDDEVVLRALTDDLARFWKGPGDPENPESWEKVYDRIASFKADYDRLANPIGIFRHAEKSAVVLPVGAPLPICLIRSNGISLQLAEGVVIAGCAVGAPSFRIDANYARLAFAEGRVRDILTMKEKEPLMTTRVLSVCGNSLLDFHVGVMPLADSDRITPRFEATINDALLQIATPKSAISSVCSDDRFHRGLTLASLPQADGGFALTPLTVKAPAAVLRSLVAMVAEPAFGDLSCFAEIAADAYRRICFLLNVASIEDDHPLSHLLPPNADLLASESLAAIFTSNQSRCTLQRQIVAEILHFRRISLRATVAADPLPSSISLSDSAHFLAVTSRGNSTRIINSSQCSRFNRISADGFVALIRYHLGWPQITVWNDRVLLGEGYAADRCRVDHSRGDSSADQPCLDVNGDHCCSCPSQFSARYTTHNNVGYALLRAAREAGASAAREPSTVELLGNTLSATQCRALFPHRRPTGPEKELIAISDACLKALDENPNDLSVIAEARDILELVAARQPADGKGLRVDLRMFDPNAAGEPTELWIDVSVVHDTAASHRAKSSNFLIAEQVNDPICAPPQTRFRQPLPPTPVVVDAAKKKIEKYAPLLQRGRVFHAANKLPRKPEFVPCILTHSGEFGDGLLRTVEWLCLCFRNNVAKSRALLFGTTAAKVTASFRRATLDSVAVALAGGWAQQLLAAGFPLH